MIQHQVLGAALLLGDFSLDQLLAHCSGSRDEVLAVLHEHQAQLRVRLPRHAGAQATQRWSVVDADPLRQYVRQASPSPVPPAAPPPTADSLLLADALLETASRATDAVQRRLLAESGRDLVRQAAASALRTDWWTVPVRARDLPDARMRTLLTEAVLLLRDPAGRGDTAESMAELATACADLEKLIRDRTPGADRICRRLVPAAIAWLQDLSSRTDVPYLDVSGGRVLRGAVARIRSPRHYPTGAAADLHGVVDVVDGLRRDGHRLSTFVGLGPGSAGPGTETLERALVSRDVLALVDGGGAARLEGAFLLGELLLVSAPPALITAMRQATGPERTLDVTAPPLLPSPSRGPLVLSEQTASSAES